MLQQELNEPQPQVPANGSAPESSEGLAKLDAGKEEDQTPVETKVEEVASAMGLEEQFEVPLLYLSCHCCTCHHSNSPWSLHTCSPHMMTSSIELVSYTEQSVSERHVKLNFILSLMLKVCIRKRLTYGHTVG